MTPGTFDQVEKVVGVQVLGLDVLAGKCISARPGGCLEQARAGLGVKGSPCGKWRGQWLGLLEPPVCIPHMLNKTAPQM